MPYQEEIDAAAKAIQNLIRSAGYSCDDTQANELARGAIRAAENVRSSHKPKWVLNYEARLKSDAGPGADELVPTKQ